MPVPNTFANATATIPLSQLDANFATTITLGNTAIQLGNTVTTLNNMTLANVNISSGIVTITNATVTTANVTNLITGNAAITGGAINGTTLGATTASTANVTTLTTSSTVTINGGTANQVQYLDGSKALVGSANLTFNGTTLSAAGLSDSGNLTFTGTGNRITGDFSNATIANRVSFQNSLTNSATVIQALTNGTGSISALQLYPNDNGVNTPYMNLISTSSDTQFLSERNGSGAYVPMFFSTGGSEAMRIDTSGNVGIGTSAPASKLHISGGTVNTARIDGSSNGGAWLVMRNGTVTGGIYNTGAIIGNTTSGVGIFAETGFDVRFYTNGSATEKARITSGGYSKFSNDGTYVGIANSYHEFRQTADDVCLVLSATNASFSNWQQLNRAERAANSAYRFLVCDSGGGADVEFILRGDGNGYADGTWNNNGADYAEFFESATGAALTLGATVVLDGNKVREATDQDPASAIMGVVRPKEPSKASMVVGNTAWNKWANKYLTDDFDRYIMEDHNVVEWEETITDEDGKTSTKQHSYESHRIPAGVTVPDDATVKTHDDKGNKFQHYKLNPAWNPDAEYVNRENRPEWIIVGLVGQVKIIKGQPVNDRWIKMRDVSATVEEWMIR